MKKISLALLTLIGCARLACADVTPMDQKQLQHALKASPPCCVIDGRSEANRKKRPLDEALIYRPGLQINPSAAIVVLGDDDAGARQVAADLDTRYPGKRILVVSGGIDTWEAVQVALSREAASGAPPGAFSFVIPKNTCESGSPLQKLRSK
jgi:hypothetical protein